MISEEDVEHYAQIAAGRAPNVPVYAHRVVARDILEELEREGRLDQPHDPDPDLHLDQVIARTQLVVTYLDHQILYYQVGPELGWRIDAASRCLVIGKMPRTYVPLDRVASFVIEKLD